jgi:hypothetical protein
MAPIERAARPAFSVVSAMSATIVTRGSRAPASVGALASAITSPSRVTTPTAVVVPPRSTPRTTGARPRLRAAALID